MFKDRIDAGRQLAEALEKYRGEDVLVLGIPRGGAEPACRVAKHLDADFSLVITRKLPYPRNPEAGFGAIAEDGSTYIFEDAARWLSDRVVDEIVEAQKSEIRRRIEVLRGGGPLPEIAGRTVILVDDGIAMGSTMRASIKLCRKQEAARIVVAVPVAGPRVIGEFERLTDDLIVLETPPFFRAVAEVYENWYDVPDAEVLGIMEKWRTEQS